MIVSYSVLYSVDQALVTVGKWALLAAGEKEINRERQRLDSSLSCAVTILGQVFERDMPDFMCLLLFFT